MFLNFDYLLFMLPALLLGLVAQMMVKSRYARYSKVMSKRGLTGAQAAQAVMEANGVTGVRISAISGELTDHYDPKANEIRLSQGVYASNSIAAVGIAAHEAGHAVQYAKNYSPVKLRMSIIPVCNLGSKIGPILVIIGFLIASAAESAALFEIGNVFYSIGIILFSAVAVFQLVTLPVEIDASTRAVRALSSTGVLDSVELSGAKKVLTAAALTYVAALVTAIMQILYFATRFRPRQR